MVHSPHLLSAYAKTASVCHREGKQGEAARVGLNCLQTSRLYNTLGH